MSAEERKRRRKRAGMSVRTPEGSSELDEDGPPEMLHAEDQVSISLSK